MRGEPWNLSQLVPLRAWVASPAQGSARGCTFRAEPPALPAGSAGAAQRLGVRMLASAGAAAPAAGADADATPPPAQAALPKRVCIMVEPSPFT